MDGMGWDGSWRGAMMVVVVMTTERKWRRQGRAGACREWLQAGAGQGVDTIRCDL